MLEKETGKIAIVDTEHFPTLVGFNKENLGFKGYWDWYWSLIKKCSKDVLFRSRSDRLS